MLKINTKKEKKPKEENKKKSIVPRYIIFLILSIILGGIFTALTSYAATIAASNISYSNTTSGLTATNAQDAINEAFNQVNKPNIGDYVYFVPTSTSAVLTSTKTGMDSDLTWNPQNVTSWIITKLDSDYYYVSAEYFPIDSISLYAQSNPLPTTNSISDYGVLLSIKNYCKNMESYSSSFKKGTMSPVGCEYYVDTGFSESSIVTNLKNELNKIRFRYKSYGSVNMFGGKSESTCGLKNGSTEKVSGELWTLEKSESELMSLSWRCRPTSPFSNGTGTRIIVGNELVYQVSYWNIRPQIKIPKTRIAGGTGTKLNPWTISD